jgi:putative adenylate-forming enzyme
MKMPFKLKVIVALFKLARERQRFERNPQAHQQRMWRTFGQTTLSKSPLYKDIAHRSIDAFPVQGKEEFNRDFNRINTRGIRYDHALQVADEAESSRDFTPTIDGVTVGLSSGTSGNRGIFLVSEEERASWVAMVLQRILGFSFRKRKVAFFLRANSKLYTSVQSRLIQFAFFDLLIPLEHHLTQLNDLQPTIVVGQPSLLMMLVEAQQQGMMHIAPQKIISVAEVLSDEDEAALKACFQVPVQQVYQCNEGMFGQTCSQGNFHLNEDGLLIEKEWLDATRFQPIITDMRRKVQPVIRYKMNDILHATECTCGSKMIAVSQIEGRTDDVLHFPGGKRVFPDFIRRTVIGAHPTISNYQIIQEGSDQLSLYVQPLDQWECAKDALGRLFEDHNIQGVSLLQLTEKRHILGTKFRRIHAQRS